jgi:hypothetical protein
VLYTSGEETDWPDQIEPTTGDFTYFGDNRSPGGLHETRRRGNQFLRDIFDAAHDRAGRTAVPPILLFQKVTRRDVIFRGLLAPGSPRLEADQELVAVWRTTRDRRFQNYRAHFTVLNTPLVSRTWINQVLAGDPLGADCPKAWRAWVQSRAYHALEAPRTTSIRTMEDQLPLVPPTCGCYRASIKHFRGDPILFEHFAANIWARFDENVEGVEVTRPSTDGGRDAQGTYRLGPTLDPIRLDFALEAKCYDPGRAIGVRMVSRLISRLKHREFGVFVTTSHVGRQAYTEVREDKHPVVFLTGRGPRGVDEAPRPWPAGRPRDVHPDGISNRGICSREGFRLSILRRPSGTRRSAASSPSVSASASREPTSCLHCGRERRSQNSTTRTLAAVRTAPECFVG